MSKSELVTIAQLEMYAVMVAVELFASALTGQRVVIFCDNQPVVAMINKGSTKCKTCMQLLRMITLKSMQYQVRFFARFIPTLENTRADALSRLDFQQFWEHSDANTENSPLELPNSVWPLRKEWWIKKKKKKLFSTGKRINKFNNILQTIDFERNWKIRGEVPISHRLSRMNDRSDTPSVSTRSTTDEKDMKYSLLQYRRIKDLLKTYKLRCSTRKSYKRTWNRFNKFISQFDTIPPRWEDRIIVWATHLADNRKKSATIKSHISAVRYCLQLDGIQVTHQSCELAAIVQIAKQYNDELYIRLPIQKDLLQLMINFIRVHYWCNLGQQYQASCLMALFSMAYHGAMRISELTEGEHAVKAQDIIYATNKRKITLYLRSSNTHTKADQPQIISIEEHQWWGKNCPVKLITQFANFRGRQSDFPEQPFFIWQDCTPVNALQFNTNLCFILFTLGLPSLLYGSHSFRVGKTTDGKISGKKISTLKKEGRWKTSTVYKYIRTAK